MILDWLRRTLPAGWRLAIRRQPWVDAALKSMIRRRQQRPHPHCRCGFAFDGHRCVGWATGGLPTWERDYFLACGKLFAWLKPRIVWDIGANVGIWTLYFADAFDFVVTVVAYEPDLFNLALLEENICSNSLEKIILVRPVALSNVVGEATFSVDAFTGSTGTLEGGESFVTKQYGRPTDPALVAVSTVDNELIADAQAPMFVKIDVEGHEWAVLRGAERLLREYRPILMIEFSGERQVDAFTFLQSHGYVMLRPTTGEIAERAEFELIAVPNERVSQARRVLGWVPTSRDGAV